MNSGEQVRPAGNDKNPLGSYEEKTQDEKKEISKIVKAEITIDKVYKVLTIRIVDKELHNELLKFFYDNAPLNTCLNCDMYDDLLNTFRVDITDATIYFDLGKKLRWKKE